MGLYNGQEANGNTRCRQEITQSCCALSRKIPGGNCEGLIAEANHQKQERKNRLASSEAQAVRVSGEFMLDYSFSQADQPRFIDSECNRQIVVGDHEGGTTPSLSAADAAIPEGKFVFLDLASEPFFDHILQGQRQVPHAFQRDFQGLLRAVAIEQGSRPIPAGPKKLSSTPKGALLEARIGGLPTERTRSFSSGSKPPARYIPMDTT